MKEDLIGYLLNGLEDAERREVETHLERNPQEKARLEKLRQALTPLQADAENPTPPSDLYVRTLSRVAEHICKPLPKSPPPSSRMSAGRSWGRRIDWVIAACLLMAIAGLGLPIINNLRANSASVAACKDNLRQFAAGLQTYHDVNLAYPNVEVESPRNVAGMVVPILRSSGALPEKFILQCPGGVIVVECSALSLDELRAMTPEEFAQHAQRLNPSYAYSLGFRAGDTVQGPKKDQALDRLLALMADRPAGEDVWVNSDNHAGRGQNVLYSDGHVQFCTKRQVGVDQDDIYINKANHVAAGVEPHDVVLGSSAAKP